MATYTASQIGLSNAGLSDLRVLLDGSTTGPVSNTVTYGNDSNLPGVTVELEGTISGAQSSSWIINTIIIQNSLGLVETITGISGVNGAADGSGNAHSLFQAEQFGGSPGLIFRGNNNVINGGPGNESLAGFGKEGNTETINANGGGHYTVVADGGTVTVNLSGKHQIVEFNTVDRLNPTANVTTVHGFNSTSDFFDLNGLTFDHLSGTPTLLASEFHLGANPQHPHGDGIWYNQHNGQIWYDFFSSALHTEVKDHVATIFGAHLTHPHLTDANFLVVA
jgi:hypothetical protein